MLKTNFVNFDRLVFTLKNKATKKLMKKRITIIISDTDKSLSLEWLVTYLDQTKCLLSFIIINRHDNNTALTHFLDKHHIQYFKIHYHNKLSIPYNIWKCCGYLKKLNTTIVHTHLLDANLIGLTAARLVGIKKRIYTRHDSTLHHLYHKKGVFYDHFNNWNATHIIATCQNVHETLRIRENVKTKKIHLIHYGFELDKFQTNTNLNTKYNPHHQSPVIGVIARFVVWKGIQYIIPAFEKLLIQYPNAMLILANARGPHEKEILNLLKNIPKKNYRLIPFENDLFSLYQSFDVLIHTPINDHIEAFGQVYVEALASKTPLICTVSGIAKELIIDNFNAMVVAYKSSEHIFERLVELLENKTTQKKLTKNGLNSVASFQLLHMIHKLEKLYA